MDRLRCAAEHIGPERKQTGRAVLFPRASRMKPQNVRHVVRQLVEIDAALAQIFFGERACDRRRFIPNRKGAPLSAVEIIDLSALCFCPSCECAGISLRRDVTIANIAMLAAPTAVKCRESR